MQITIKDSEDQYKKYVKTMEDAQGVFESKCKRCGLCCGSQDGDPCAYLLKNDNGTYDCKVYSDRIGYRKTVSGKNFYCVSIRELIKTDSLRPDCGYRER